MNIKKTIQELFSIAILKTIYFNFYYLPFKQAIKLPILLYGKVKLKSMAGTVNIDFINPSFGLIKIGKSIVSLYINRGFSVVWENRGKITFNGKFILGEGSVISTGLNGYLKFGNNFGATSNFKIACYHSIKIGDNCRFSWENKVIDTDFHKTINSITGERSVSEKKIIIGKNNWIGIQSIILKGTETPDFCTIGPQSIVNKKYFIPEYSLIAGSPAELKKENIYMDLDSFTE